MVFELEQEKFWHKEKVTCKNGAEKRKRRGGGGEKSSQAFRHQHYNDFLCLFQLSFP